MYNTHMLAVLAVAAVPPFVITTVLSRAGLVLFTFARHLVFRWCGVLLLRSRRGS